ncbi:p49 [Clostera anachoreta granulovirus]|uniref:p49 n=1 Tax=Clostera anachoreta granulovirus TaxID=283675 RepID=E7CU99_9BBAC|nr:p49 [Clostera anachoreta granulovirus]ADU24596.1 p49 [Clostera anachoreta granulovirus]AEB00302.1 p49 [Clostera anachoreta granulovirus]
MNLDHNDLLPLAFVHMYFDIRKKDVLPEVWDYINNKNNKRVILDYVATLNLRNVVVDSNDDVFDFVKPQFRYVSEKDYHLEIVKYENEDLYLQKGTVIYATNLFVSNPSTVLQYFVNSIPDFTKLSSAKANVGEKFYVWNGTDGLIFSQPYVDWMGMKVCNGVTYAESTKYRLYILGETVAKIFVHSNLLPDGDDIELKNYHKGTPLRRTNNETQVINHKRVVTDNVDVVFDLFEEEFKNNIDSIHFVQRDYIYDGSFPVTLMEELQRNWVSDTSLCKVVHKFTKNALPNVGTMVVVDRYSLRGYRKVLVNGGGYVLPKNESSNVNYLFVPRDVLQISHTLNAAYVPNLGLVILSTHVFFGARSVLKFDPNVDMSTFVKTKTTFTDDDVLYHIAEQYFLEETNFTDNNIDILVLVRVDKDVIVRHNLINNSRNLKDLKSNWVFNTILTLFVKRH